MSELHMPPPSRAADELGILLLKPEAAAQVLSVSRNKVYELMRSGALPSVKLGSSRRVITAGLVEFVARLAEESAA
jgi:excisionase family DNA binding protein